MAHINPAQFVAKGLLKHNEVAQALALDAQLVEVHRKQYDDFIVGVISTARVEPAAIMNLVQDDRVDFVCNIPREAVWSGAAIDLVRMHGKAWGGVADLFSAAGSRQPAHEFVRREYEFIERIFDQHSAVVHVERIYDRVYRLHRDGKSPVQVVLINEYDLTVDHVRTAWERYGPFSDILANNPNCRFSSEATDAASELGVKLLTLSPFMGRLNSP